MLFLKKIDSLVGKAATNLFGRLTTQLRSSIPACDSLLIIRPGGIGDAVLLIPYIQAVKVKYPSASVTVLAEQRNGAVFSLTKYADRVLLYDRPRDLWLALRNKYDVVIDTEQWHRLSAVVARLSGAPKLIGFATNDRKKLFTHSVSYSHDDYELESFFHLFSPVGIKKPELLGTPFLTVPETEYINANLLLGAIADKPYIVFFPGASIPERRWGAEKFRGVAERFEAKGLSVVVVGGGADVADGERIVSGLTGLNLAGKTSLAETAAVIAQSALLVSGDSGILHIAVGLGKPTVSLFGPGIARKWAPRGEKHVVLNKNLPCSPCTKFGYTPKCPISARCMSEISVEEVTAAVVELFERCGKR